MTANAHRYLQAHCKGYFPYHPAWRDMYIDSEGWLNTPHGSCTSGDVAMIWRYKWSMQNSSMQIKILRAQLQELKSGSTAKMIVHTVDYLSRLVSKFKE